MKSSVKASGGIFLVPDMVTSMDTFVMTPFPTATSDVKGTQNLPALDPFALELRTRGHRSCAVRSLLVNGNRSFI